MISSYTFHAITLLCFFFLTVVLIISCWDVLKYCTTLPNNSWIVSLIHHWNRNLCNCSTIYIIGNNKILLYYHWKLSVSVYRFHYAWLYACPCQLSLAFLVTKLGAQDSEVYTEIWLRNSVSLLNLFRNAFKM